MTDSHDDLDAVRAIVAALEPFDEGDRERVLRWACEKLGLSVPGTFNTTAALKPAVEAPASERSNAQSPAADLSVAKVDLKSFVAEKAPKSNAQFAAAVAYYYAFEAPEADRKEEISGDDLIEACRHAGRARLQDPGQTLRDALRAGFVDRAGRGAFRLNTVGENLVAMTLPGGDGSTSPVGRRPGRAAAKKAPAKKAPAKKAPAKKRV